MRHVLVEASKRFGLVVVGYSGRDASVMEALKSVLKDPNPYPSGLYWVTSSASKLLPAVQQFLEHATLAGVDVAIVEAKTFDELAADVRTKFGYQTSLASTSCRDGRRQGFNP